MRSHRPPRRLAGLATLLVLTTSAATAENPQRFRSLALVTPTGFRRGSDQLRAEEGTTREMAFLTSFFSVPLWRRGIYNLLVSP